MVQGRRVRLLVAAAAAGVAVVAGGRAFLAGTAPAHVDRARPLPSAAASAAAGTPTPAPPAAPPAVSPGHDALVAVAVATVWNAPDQARPVDAPSLTNPVDVRRWTSTMTNDEKLWLVDKLATQVLYGERVTVRDVRGDWASVVVPDQPSSQDAAGYPGWLPVAQLTGVSAADTGRSAVVIRPTASLRERAAPAHELLELSYDTRLPVLAADATLVTVATPTAGGSAVVAAADVDVQAPGPRPTTGGDIVRSAQLFSGLPYLWAGTSAAGFDCSGFTAAVYGAHGIVLPRDADDQALKGTPVDRAHLQPGDLLFYAYDGGKGAIHHVSIYVGNGMMIQSPATGKTVETVPVDTPSLAPQFWGARRYLAA
ncbi:MAG TPA: C40 family peptidase [Acidimicrobiales bacterium]|nr:C40 family peptidase [Acidimicrobiales bacterium]